MEGRGAAAAVGEQACSLLQGTARFWTSRKAPFIVLAGGKRRPLLPLVGVSTAACVAALRTTYLILAVTPPPLRLRPPLDVMPAWWDERVHSPPYQTVLDAVELKDDVTHTL